VIILQAELRHAELKKLGLDGKIVLIGKKGITYFNRRTGKYDIVGEPSDSSAYTAAIADLTDPKRVIGICEPMSGYTLPLGLCTLPRGVGYSFTWTNYVLQTRSS